MLIFLKPLYFIGERVTESVVKRNYDKVYRHTRLLQNITIKLLPLQALEYIAY